MCDLWKIKCINSLLTALRIWVTIVTQHYPIFIALFLPSTDYPSKVTQVRLHSRRKYIMRRNDRIALSNINPKAFKFNKTLLIFDRARERLVEETGGIHVTKDIGSYQGLYNWVWRTVQLGQETKAESLWKEKRKRTGLMNKMWGP